MTDQQLELKEKLLIYFNKDWEMLDFNEEYSILAIKVIDEDRVGMLCQNDDTYDKTVNYIHGKLKQIFLYFTQNKEELEFYNIIETDNGKIYYPKYNDYMMIIYTPGGYAHTQEGALYVDPYIEGNRLYLSDRRAIQLKHQHTMDQKKIELKRSKKDIVIYNRDICKKIDYQKRIIKKDMDDYTDTTTEEEDSDLED